MATTVELTVETGEANHSKHDAVRQALTSHTSKLHACSRVVSQHQREYVHVAAPQAEILFTYSHCKHNQRDALPTAVIDNKPEPSMTSGQALSQDLFLPSQQLLPHFHFRYRVQGKAPITTAPYTCNAAAVAAASQAQLRGLQSRLLCIEHTQAMLHANIHIICSDPTRTIS
jgi:hypothetical protein